MKRFHASFSAIVLSTLAAACSGGSETGEDPVTTPGSGTDSPMTVGSDGMVVPVGPGVAPPPGSGPGGVANPPPGTGPTGPSGPTGASGPGVMPPPQGTPTDPVPGGGSGPVGSGGAPAPVTGGNGPGPSGGGTPGVAGAPVGVGGGGSGAPAVDPEPPVPEPTLILSGENDYWQISELVEGGSSANVTVNDTQAQQDWHGFGGTFNEKGWDALSHLSEEDRQRALELLFDKTDGAAFTHARIPIGSSDYALSRYSLAETANDYEMANFSIDRDREALIPYIKAAMDINPDIWFWASPWSPPPWMKNNNAFDRGSMKNDAQTLGAHALYLARFVEEYEKEGIIVRAVHPQNEAGYEQDYPSCAWTASQMVDYMKNHLAPTFEERGLTAEIWGGTYSNPTIDHQIGQAVMGDSALKSIVKGVGLQWGLDAQINTYRQYGVPVMQTEHKCGNYPWETATYRSDRAPNDHAYAVESWGFFKTWIGGGVNSYMAWNMVLDTIGRSLDDVRPWNQNALITVDTGAGRLIPTPYYWVFRHLSQYVEPGAKRVSTQGGDALAFKNPDGSIVTVIHNSGGQAAQTTLAVGGSTYQFSIPARGWATANWQP